MPVHVDSNRVLDQDGKLVPGGEHDTHEEAVKHAEAMNINMQREERRPVAPKPDKALSTEERDRIPDSDFVDPERRRFYIQKPADVMDAVQSYGRANPKIPFEHFKQRLTAIARRKGFESSLPTEWKNEKASWLADPTDDDLYQWLVNEDMDPYLGMMKDDKVIPQPTASPYVNNVQGDLLADRSFYHPVDEQFQIKPAPDWNSDVALTYTKDAPSLPAVWVRAHPYGSPTQKDRQGNYFDRQTNFFDDPRDKRYTEMLQIPVSYYHNRTPDGYLSDEPTPIGKTSAHAYLVDGQWQNMKHVGKAMPKLPNVRGAIDDGRWDYIVFDPGMDADIGERLAKAIAEGTLRSSPTVIPDFHNVNDRTGHIDDWLTGSIAVLDADGERQPASPKAIGVPAMKALFKAAQIPFPKQLEASKMGRTTTKAAPLEKARTAFKAFMKALNEDEETPTGEAQFHGHSNVPDGHSHEGGDQPHHHEGEDMKAVFQVDVNNPPNPEDYWTNRFNGPQTDRDRYGGGTNFQKDVQPLADNREAQRAQAAADQQLNPIKDQDIQVDWERENQEKRMMKAQIAGLQKKSDDADFLVWFTAQAQAGKALPAEHDELYIGYMQALAVDRRYHPVMKAANGQSVTMLTSFCGAVERRDPRFNSLPLDKATIDQMKAMGFQVGGFDGAPGAERPMTEKQFRDSGRREELLKMTPMGSNIVNDERRGK